MVNRFKGGFSGTTYTCGDCGRETRETGHGESSCDLCAFCYQEAGLENELNDGHIDDAEFDKQIAELEKKYGRKSRFGKTDEVPAKKPVAKCQNPFKGAAAFARWYEDTPKHKMADLLVQIAQNALSGNNDAAEIVKYLKML